MNVRSALSLVAALAALSAGVGCGGDEQPYTPRPAVSGKKASLPAVPTLPTKVKKQGDAYTIWGVTHDLRSRVHAEENLDRRLHRQDEPRRRPEVRDPQDRQG